jgi:hypothetical protein
MAVVRQNAIRIKITQAHQHEGLVMAEFETRRLKSFEPIPGLAEARNRAA